MRAVPWFCCVWGDRINAIEMTKAHEMKDGYLASESPYQIDPACPQAKKIAARAAYFD
jgi:hypothetical protein